MTSNAKTPTIASMSLMSAEPRPPGGARGGGAPRLRDRSRTGTALLAALGEPPPVAAGGGHGRQARPARTPRHPPHPRGRTPGAPRHGDRRPRRRGDQRTRRPRRAAHRPRTPGRQRLRNEHDRPEGGQDPGRSPPGPGAEHHRPAPGGGAADAAPGGRGRGPGLPLRTRPTGGRRLPPDPRDGRPDPPGQPSPGRHRGQPPQLTVDRQLRTLPERTDGGLHPPRLHAADRLGLRRHGRRPGPRGGRNR